MTWTREKPLCLGQWPAWWWREAPGSSPVLVSRSLEIPFFTGGEWAPCTPPVDGITLHGKRLERGSAHYWVETPDTPAAVIVTPRLISSKRLFLFEGGDWYGPLEVKP